MTHPNRNRFDDEAAAVRSMLFDRELFWQLIEGPVDLLLCNREQARSDVGCVESSERTLIVAKIAFSVCSEYSTHHTRFTYHRSSL